jgi:hypothetical protein
VIPRRYGQIKRQAGEGVALQVDAADALTRFARILADSRSPTTVRLYVGVVQHWLAFGGAVVATQLTVSSNQLTLSCRLAASSFDSIGLV